MNWNLLSILLSVTTVFLDVPDGEDAVWVSDADLDVGFFTDPTPCVDTFANCSRNKHSPGGIDRLIGCLKLGI